MFQGKRPHDWQFAIRQGCQGEHGIILRRRLGDFGGGNHLYKFFTLRHHGNLALHQEGFIKGLSFLEGEIVVRLEFEGHRREVLRGDQSLSHQRTVFLQQRGQRNPLHGVTSLNHDGRRCRRIYWIYRWHQRCRRILSQHRTPREHH